MVCRRQIAIARSRSVMPAVTAPETISFTLRKSLRPLESQGLMTSVSPMFSSRTDRLDSQLWVQIPNPPPIGDRQFTPSIVPP